MMTGKYMKQAALLVMVASLTACGGGGGGTANPANTQIGTITGFGSVFVNGIEFDTSSTQITVDDQSATENDLKVGMLVTVSGPVDDTTGQGTATSIDYSDDIEGIVISNNIAAGQTTGVIDIMGQAVTVDSMTIMESKVAGVSTPDQIAAGMIVEVSGHSDGNGSVLATRIEVKAADLATYLATHPEGVEVKGVVANHDPNNSQFDIGNMTVLYAGAVLDDMPAGSFDGLYVEVKSIQGLDTNGDLIASKVELENNGSKAHHGNDNDEIEIKGVISTGIDANDNFVVNGQTFHVDANTQYEDISKSGLLAGVLVEVEAYYQNGQLVAKEVELEDSAGHSYTEVKDTVASVATTGTNSGDVTLQGGLVIRVTPNTIMKDDRDNGVTPDPKFNLQGLMPGDYVEIYYFDDNGTLTAIKLKRDD